MCAAIQFFWRSFLISAYSSRAAAYSSLRRARPSAAFAVVAPTGLGDVLLALVLALATLALRLPSTRRLVLFAFVGMLVSLSNLIRAGQDLSAALGRRIFTRRPWFPS